MAFSKRDLPEDPAMKPLSPREEAFVREYVIDFNAVRAMNAAGFSPKTAKADSWEMVKRPHVKRAVEEIKKERWLAQSMSAEEVRAEYAKIARADLKRVLTPDGEGGWALDLFALPDEESGAISEITQEETFERGRDGKPIRKVRTKIKMHSKTVALDAMRKIHGMDAPAKSEITGPDGKPLPVGGTSVVVLVDRSMSKL